MLARFRPSLVLSPWLVRRIGLSLDSKLQHSRQAAISSLVPLAGSLDLVRQLVILCSTSVLLAGK